VSYEIQKWVIAFVGRKNGKVSKTSGISEGSPKLGTLFETLRIIEEFR
jgi:hypothetical protein